MKQYFIPLELKTLVTCCDLVSFHYVKLIHCNESCFNWHAKVKKDSPELLNRWPTILVNSNRQVALFVMKKDKQISNIIRCFGDIAVNFNDG